jgi:hypothetical protein
MNFTPSNGSAPKAGVSLPFGNASCGASQAQRSSTSKGQRNDSPYVSIAVLQARYDRKLRLAAKTDARRGALVTAALLALLGVFAVTQIRKPQAPQSAPAPNTEISSGRIGSLAGYQPYQD